MDGQNYLGIYIGKDTATAVCLGAEGKDYKVLGCFSVTAEKQDGQNEQQLPRLIAEGCAERELKFSEVAVALDCVMFMQHNVHSDFKDIKQIAATIRFDTEEALSTDITDAALAFRINSSDQAGSGLTVFTAQRKILSDILLAFQSNNLDPISIEPDINCLARFISQNVSLPDDLSPLFGLLSRRSGYFVVLSRSQEAPIGRTFLVGPTQNRTELLAGEVPVTIAFAETDEPINCVKVSDSTGSVDCQRLSEKLGIEAGSLDLPASVGADPQALTDCADTVDFAIAYGAALAHLEKAQSVNFRNDFMPYQGKRVRLEKTLKFLSVSVAALCLALGLYFQSRLLKVNSDRGRLHAKFANEYKTVTLGATLPAKNPLTKLKRVKSKIQAQKSGVLSIKGEEAISEKLTLLLGAFNSCAKQTRLAIDSISITDKAIRITGSTSSRPNTARLRQALLKTKLGSLQDTLELKGGRDNFRITILPGK